MPKKTEVKNYRFIFHAPRKLFVIKMDAILKIPRFLIEGDISRKGAHLLKETNYHGFLWIRGYHKLICHFIFALLIHLHL